MSLYTYTPPKPYTSSTLISKSPLGHSGGLLKVEHLSVLPKRIFSSIHMAWPSLKINNGKVLVISFSVPYFVIFHYIKKKKNGAYPPPIVIICGSAAINNSLE